MFDDTSEFLFSNEPGGFRDRLPRARFWPFNTEGYYARDYWGYEFENYEDLMIDYSKREYELQARYEFHARFLLASRDERFREVGQNILKHYMKLWGRLPTGFMLPTSSTPAAFLAPKEPRTPEFVESRLEVQAKIILLRLQAIQYSFECLKDRSPPSEHSSHNSSSASLTEVGNLESLPQDSQTPERWANKPDGCADFEDETILSRSKQGNSENSHGRKRIGRRKMSLWYRKLQARFTKQSRNPSYASTRSSSDATSSIK